jgi:virginiamycin B lyase
VGPDGNLWFTEENSAKIGMITTAGVITEYAVPTSSPSPTAMVTGSDGNLWFAESGANAIGHITTTGGTQSIASGPDGELWFPGYLGSAIWHVAP